MNNCRDPTNVMNFFYKTMNKCGTLDKDKHPKILCFKFKPSL